MPKIFSALLTRDIGNIGIFAEQKKNQTNGAAGRASHRGDQGGPLVPLGENKNNKGGPGGTSLPLSVPRLPIRNFPHFF